MRDRTTTRAMTRPLRLDTIVPGFPHPVVVRGNNRRLLFSTSTDRAAFVKYLVEAPYFADCQFHACALQSNHGHLVTTPSSQEALSECMRIACQRHAMRRNRMRGGSGNVFEQRFYADPIRTERQLAATLAYVDLNPERAGLGRVAFKWSTRGIHEGVSVDHPLRCLWTPSSWWLSLGSTDIQRGERYREFLQNRREGWEQDVVRSGAVASAAYTRRVVRPNGTSAR